jgi:hypothetical protein
MLILKALAAGGDHVSGIAWHGMAYHILCCPVLPLHPARCCTKQSPAGYFDWEDLEQFIVSKDGSKVTVNLQWLQQLQSRVRDGNICKAGQGEDPHK